MCNEFLCDEGLLRCGKSCRLRWMNYLRPDIKRGNITPDEDDLIIRMHSLLGNRWSLIAGRLPGRTDNEIKNYWNTHLSKRLRSQGTDPNTHKKLAETVQQQGKKKKKNNNNTSRNSKNKNNKAKVELEKAKVIHLPRPVRFSSLSLLRNDSFECNTSLSSCQGGEGEGEGGLSAEAVTENPWCSFKYDHDDGISFLVGDVDHDIVNGPDLGCVPASNANLEKLYEEYLQLLKTDDDHGKLDYSYAESLSL